MYILQQEQLEKLVKAPPETQKIVIDKLFSNSLIDWRALILTLQDRFSKKERHNLLCAMIEHKEFPEESVGLLDYFDYPQDRLFEMMKNAPAQYKKFSKTLIRTPDFFEFFKTDQDVELYLMFSEGDELFRNFNKIKEIYPSYDNFYFLELREREEQALRFTQYFLEKCMNNFTQETLSIFKSNLLKRLFLMDAQLIIDNSEKLVDIYPIDELINLFGNNKSIFTRKELFGFPFVFQEIIEKIEEENKENKEDKAHELLLVFTDLLMERNEPQKIFFLLKYASNLVDVQSYLNQIMTDKLWEKCPVEFKTPELIKKFEEPKYQQWQSLISEIDLILT